MGRRALPKSRDLDPEIRHEYLSRLLPLFIETGMSKASMDEIAQYLKISKATFYKHFSTRDELFELFTHYVIDQILKTREYLHDRSRPYHERYLYAFAAILQEINGIGVDFLSDMRTHLPELWKQIQAMYDVWEKELLDFFKEGIEAEIIEPVNPAILSHMIVLYFRELIRPEYLKSLNMTLSEAFVEIFKIQIKGIVRLENFEFDRVEEKMRDLLPQLIQASREMAD